MKRRFHRDRPLHHSPLGKPLMGSIIIIVYLPLYLIFSIISISVRNINRNARGHEHSKKMILKFRVMGFIIAIIFTWVLIWLVPVIGSLTGETDFKKQFLLPVLQLCLTLIAPIILVLVARLFFPKRKTEKYFSVGVLLSTLFMPWVTLLSFSIF
jgi:riboflavin transporter FmnP